MGERVQEIIDLEIQGLRDMAGAIAGPLEAAVALVEGASGRLVVTGLGKSGHVGAKWAATLASLGTPSFFLHSAEALHGDLGMLAPGDVVAAISNSGTTPEVVAVAEFAQREGFPVIAVTKNADSPLAKAAKVVLPLPSTPEADPNGLAPTTSTTATLVLGDVLAILLAERKGFTKEDFGHVHPGGALGQAARDDG